jgi:glutathione S-transferase
MAATLCYWDIRGLAQPIRLLLEYTGTQYEDKKLSCGPPPSFDKSCWLDNKFSLGLDFPNLPYYIDGDVKLTQSNAILKHIGRKNNLVGTTIQAGLYTYVLGGGGAGICKFTYLFYLVAGPPRSS